MIKANKKGFTLIELMVVIAIIAILATVVLVSLQSARDRAEDTNRVSAVTQIRSFAEVYRSGLTTLSYDGLDEEAEIEDTLTKYADELDLVISSDGENYCAEIELKTGGFYCVDSSLTAKDNSDKTTRTCASGNISCN